MQNGADRPVTDVKRNSKPYLQNTFLVVFFQPFRPILSYSAKCANISKNLFFKFNLGQNAKFNAEFEFVEKRAKKFNPKS